MTESNPPEPPPEPTPEPASEPTPEPPPDLPPEQPPPTPQPQSSGHTLLYGCLSILFALPFGIAYILLSAAFGLGGGAACAAAIVLGMFLLRRDQKKPIVGALAVGAAIAFALYGTCLIIIAKST
jgi:hypothetical protein